MPRGKWSRTNAATLANTARFDAIGEEEFSAHRIFQQNLPVSYGLLHLPSSFRIQNYAFPFKKYNMIWYHISISGYIPYMMV